MTGHLRRKPLKFQLFRKIIERNSWKTPVISVEFAEKKSAELRGAAVAAVVGRARRPRRTGLDNRHFLFIFSSFPGSKKTDSFAFFSLVTSPVPLRALFAPVLSRPFRRSCPAEITPAA